MSDPEKGLTSSEAEEQLNEYGSNELEEEDPTTKWDVLRRQFSSVLIWILAVAAVISLAVGEMLEFYFISAIIGLIAAMGFIQEWKAEKAMEELQNMTNPTVDVYRNGELTEVESENLVPGDVIKLEMGDKIPADADIIESTDIRIDEAILTGESNPVSKEDRDEIYSGTTIVHGRCEAEVTKTGMDSKLGEIADEIQDSDDETPLQRKIDSLGKKLGVIAVIISIFVFALGVTDPNANAEAILIVTLALAVASIPEALPLTLTLTLSLGMKDMAKKNAIVKKMLAVEGLGSTTVICTDKTGTLTKNEMTVKKMYLDNEELDVDGSGYIPEGDITDSDGEKVDLDRATLQKALKTSLLCNNATLQKEEASYMINGEPTEGALVVLGEKTGLDKEELSEKFERKKEILFTSERKMMTTVHDVDGLNDAFVKGAPEVVLDKCSSIMVNGKKIDLSEDKKQELLEKNEEFAEDALRVLALAYREDVSKPFTDDNIEEDLTFLGLAGMIDPAREEVEEAIDECYTAGVGVKMVTGDNPVTAKAIAQDIGLADDPKVLTGPEIEEMSKEELEEKVPEVDVYARTQPEHKLHIVEALKEDGEIVAMTGDGVNDAPAVKKADVGIGMGQKGTDVTKESADMILQDDNFETIVSAIKDGRRIYDNIEKFTTYLISRSYTEISIIALGLIFLGFEFLPLIALQILFLNVIGQEMPSIALGLDPATEGIMERDPRPTDQRLLDSRNLFLVVSMAVFMGITGFIVFLLGNPTENLDTARTMVFAAIVLMIMAHAFNFRSLTNSIFNIGLADNKWILLSIATIAPVLLALIYWEPAASLFGHTPLGLREWLITLGGAVATMGFVEAIKKSANKIYGRGY